MADKPNEENKETPQIEESTLPVTKANKQLQRIVKKEFSLRLPDNYEQQITFFDGLVKARPKLQNAFTAMLLVKRAEELGLGWATALSGGLGIIPPDTIYLSIHTYRALAIKHGIQSLLIEDMQPLYWYMYPGKGVKGEVVLHHIKEEDLDLNLFQVAEAFNSPNLNKDKITVIRSRNMVTGEISVAYNYRTTYTFTRELKDGTIKEFRQSYTKLEALDAGLLTKADGTPKTGSAWLSYMKLKLRHSAFAFGIREIADDIFGGILTEYEAKDINNVEYTIED